MSLRQSRIVLWIRENFLPPWNVPPHGGCFIKKESWPLSTLSFSLWGGGKQNSHEWYRCGFPLSSKVRCLQGYGLSFASRSFYLLSGNCCCHQIRCKKLPGHDCLWLVALVSWFCELILAILLPEDSLILVYQYIRRWYIGFPLLCVFAWFSVGSALSWLRVVYFRTPGNAIVSTELFILKIIHVSWGQKEMQFSINNSTVYKLDFRTTFCWVF